MPFSETSAAFHPRTSDLERWEKEQKRAKAPNGETDRNIMKHQLNQLVRNIEKH